MKPEENRRDEWEDYERGEGGAKGGVQGDRASASQMRM